MTNLDGRVDHILLGVVGLHDDGACAVEHIVSATASCQ